MSSWGRERERERNILSSTKYICVYIGNHRWLFCPCTEVSLPVLCRLWVGYQYVITGRNHSLEGRWEVAFKGKYSYLLSVKWNHPQKILLKFPLLLLSILWFLDSQDHRGQGTWKWGVVAERTLWVGILPTSQALCVSTTSSGAAAVSSPTVDAS